MALNCGRFLLYPILMLSAAFSPTSASTQSKSDLERSLEDLYTKIWTMEFGKSSTEARSQVRESIAKAKEDAKREGTDKLPHPYGEYLLRLERTKPEVLLKARREGATDADVRSWWNMHDLERRLVVENDGMHRIAVFTYALQKGRTPAEAAGNVRKYFPIFGDPSDTSLTSGDDRPLPYELKDRVNLWIQKQMASADIYKRRVEESSTFNALVRSEIRAGRL